MARNSASIVTMGIVAPDGPAMGFGYIECGEDVDFGTETGFCRVKRFVEAKGIADLVEFAGEIPDAGVYMTCGQTLIAPSRWEGMPYLLLEAVARGRRVIASDCPGNRDVLKNYAPATLFSVEDYIALAGLLS
ncbi:MAG: glycosyltransferase [Kiritimatiellae bacterium]|nr:glycosyltransferase [Kiritimatiellia bacterium]